MTAFGCTECRDLAPELALGIASGEERAAALRHLARCVDCRNELRQLTETADQLLLAAPEAEPSAGFEQRVVNGVDDPRDGRWSRRKLVSAAAVVVVALAAGAVVGWLAARPDDAQRQYASAPDEIDGRSLRVASLGMDDEGSRVVAYDGDPSWLLVMIGGDLGDGDYTIVCEYEGGWSRSPGTVAVHDGRGTWAATIPRTLADLTGVQIETTEGAPVANAQFG